MKRVNVMVMLGCLWLYAGAAYALVPASYDFVLSQDANTYEYMVNSPLTSGKLLVFDYWYDLDPAPDCPEGQRRYIDDCGMRQDLTIQRGGSWAILDTLYSYFPSTAWRTNILDFPQGNDIYFTMPLHMGSQAEATDWMDRIMDNRYYIKDVRFYSDYSSYLASNNGESNPSPVPEPGTLMLMSTGGFGFLWHKIRRKK